MGLRIAFLLDRWDPERGGGERVLARAARHLEERGHEVLAVACEARPGSPGRHVRVSAPRFSWARGRFEATLADRLERAARNASPDLIIGMRHVRDVDVYWPQAGAHRAALRARAESRGRPAPEPYGRHRVFVALEEALFAGPVREVWCVSSLVQREFAELYPEASDRLVLLPSGLHLERFASLSRVPRSSGPGATRLLFVGREPWLKGLDLLLESLARLEREDWSLAVCGLRKARPWRRRARTLGIGERVHFEPNVTIDDRLAASDLVCLPSYRDSAGLVVLEALAAGVPVVTTERVGEASIVSKEAGTVIARPSVELLIPALASWVDRLSRGADPDRSVTRACVQDRSEGRWLRRIEERLVALVES